MLSRFLSPNRYWGETLPVKLFGAVSSQPMLAACHPEAGTGVRPRLALEPRKR